MSKPFDRDIVTVGKLPDGGYAARNDGDLGNLKIDDLRQILDAFKLWWTTQYKLKSVD